ncbi:TPA: signal peptidase I [Candidatus Woesearchaeota archaeon]|nr:signal peptidase I [Candidatus Woesearchaeota archaeon]
MNAGKAAGRAWNFVWNGNNVWSWLINALLAFALIKFLVYPGLGLVLQTNNPVVAVISNSMQHNAAFEDWWEEAEKQYAMFNITREQFENFTMKNGFSKGDIIILKGKTPQDTKRGDILVFRSDKPEPIIHRVVTKQEKEGGYVFSTKGDNTKSNPGQRPDETAITEERVIGTALLKIPYAGYVKIAFTNIASRIFGGRTGG